MSSEAVAETLTVSEQPPRRKSWIYMLIAVLVLVAFVYLDLAKRKDNAANNDFYRVLYEASNEFKENLLRLDSMHKSCASAYAIRSLLPSYSETGRERCEALAEKVHVTEKVHGKGEDFKGESASKKNEKPRQRAVEDLRYSYRLNGQSLKITMKAERKDTGKLATDTLANPKTIIEAHLNVADILPQPKNGFSRLLFADSDRNVLATTGGEKTISIVDLNNIASAIQEKKRGFWAGLRKQHSAADRPGESRLPGYGSHIDMQLSYGKFRVFIFPFTLTNKVEKEHCDKAEETKLCAIEKLYLVGLLPKRRLLTRGSGRWNVSLLLVTLVSLLFMWTLMRVYLLPKSQSITPLYRGFTMLSGYAFYVVIIALVLAFMHTKVLQMRKDETASDYAQKLNDGLHDDLLEVFQGLDGYRGYYQSLVKGLSRLTRDMEKNLAQPKTPTERQDFSPASAEFTKMIEQSLNSIAIESCSDITSGLLPNYAVTPYNIYPLNVTCTATPTATLAHFKAKFDKSAEQVLLYAYKNEAKKAPTLAFMAGNLNVNVKPTHISYIKRGEKSYLRSNAFTVFAFSELGLITLPSIHYQERNAPALTTDVSHRDYYKQVRDTNGWSPRLCLNTTGVRAPGKCRFENVYIQRLLNINDGTRGTTISMPMYNPVKTINANDEGLAGYTLGADVVLPSLSLAEPAPYDFTYMVVDRNSGDVLFHSDESRTLVENLFYSGNSKSKLSQWIKAGLDHYPELGGATIKGDYHGKTGRFALISTPVDAWVIVVFYPNDSLDSFMTNQFLFISLTFAMALLLVTGLLFSCRYFMSTRRLKRVLSIPQSINGRMLIMGSSVLLGVTYSLYNIGLLFDLSRVYPQVAGKFSILLPAAALLLLLIYLLLWDSTARFRGANSNNCSAKRSMGLKRPFTSVVALAALHLSYLQHAAPMSMKGLEFHYQQLHCNRLNYERQESIKLALSRYPHTITEQRVEPLTLLPIVPAVRSKLEGKQAICQQHSSQIEPADSPNVSTQIGAMYYWQWLNTHVLTADFSLATPMAAEYALNRAVAKKALPMTIPVATNHSFGLMFWLLLLVCTCVLLPTIIFGWVVFNRRLLWSRFYFPDLFLVHIERLCRSQSLLAPEKRNMKLVIECGNTKLNGVDLALLVRAAATADNKSMQSMANKLSPGFDKLYECSPYLKLLYNQHCLPPNLKLEVMQDQAGEPPSVRIWDIETSLETPENRQYLLNLIMEIKSLTLAGQLNNFTIFTGFHSLQRVKIKDSLSMPEESKLEHTEYLSWAECLMDFNIKVPDALADGLDQHLLHQEIANFPELGLCLADRQVFATPTELEDKLWKQRKIANTASQWNTINYILLHAEHLYRFKWESCSNAEKLALFSLAKKRKLNPCNTQMIEHLALNGLIKTAGGHLQIVNNSFAHFIVTAETTNTLKRMVSRSQEGVWKNYRLPLGFLVVLIIGGIALTSGESIYIIAASVAGILTTIAGVTNSAHLLRGQLRE